MLIETANSNRDRVTPQEDGVVEFSRTGWDGTRVDGWAWKDDGSRRGTLFILHGYCDHSGEPGRARFGFETARRHGLGLVGFDFRGHGRSETKEPTFGTAEMWDFQAAMTEAEERGFPKPFIAFGDSMGAMAAQRTAISDGRVAGAFLLHPPGWPWHALGATTTLINQFLGRQIDAAYGGWKILDDGDVRTQSPTPVHAPLVFYIMGDRDHFDWSKTRDVFDHWYRTDPRRNGGLFKSNQLDACMESLDNEEARKWFMLVEGAGHTADPASPTPQVWAWHGFNALFEKFLARCLHARRNGAPDPSGDSRFPAENSTETSGKVADESL